MPDDPTPNNSPATLQDLAATEQRITAAIAAAEERAAERARDLQTEILRGLESFARGNFARFHTVESNQTDINTRMAALEERVLYLETRRPPQQGPQRSAHRK
jgi:hypothetical protein